MCVSDLLESAGLYDVADALVGAWVSVARVDDGLACLAVESGHAVTLEVSVRPGLARRPVLAGILPAKVAL